MYVWQMNDGRWHISRLTHIQLHESMWDPSIECGFETEKEAREALQRWRENGGVEKRAW